MESGTSHGGFRLGSARRHENHRPTGVWGLRRLLCRREDDAHLHLHIQTGGKWVRQPSQETGLMQALTDDNTRDMYWCAVLKFLCDLLLTTPSE